MTARPAFADTVPAPEHSAGDLVMIDRRTGDARLRVQPDDPGCPPPRRSLLVRAWRRVRIAYLRWLIAGDIDYLERCRHDGLVDSLSVRAFRHQLQARECELIALDTD